MIRHGLCLNCGSLVSFAQPSAVMMRCRPCDLEMVSVGDALPKRIEAYRKSAEMSVQMAEARVHACERYNEDLTRQLAVVAENVRQCAMDQTRWRELLARGAAAVTELGRIAAACGDFFSGGELLSGDVLRGVESMGLDRDGWQARAYRAERDLLGARADVERLTRERDEIDATRLGYQAEAMAEVSRLRAALAELGPREDCDGTCWARSRCRCNTEHNAKVAAALKEKP